MTAGLRADGVLVVNVHETVWSEPHTWLTVFAEFLRIHYCVKIS